MVRPYRHSPSVQPFSGGEASQAMNGASADRRRGEIPVELRQQPSVLCLFSFSLFSNERGFYICKIVNPKVKNKI